MTETTEHWAVIGDLPEAYLRTRERVAWVDLYRQGATYREVAAEFGVSHETVRLHIRRRTNDQHELDRLDAISRKRALSEAESILMERLIYRIENGTHKRAGYGDRKVLARAGMGRQRA